MRRLILLLICTLASTLLFAADEDATALWRQPTGGFVVGAPLAGAKSLYAASQDGNLYAFSYSGALLWKHHFESRPRGQLFEGLDGSVYDITGQRRLVALNPRGEELWQRDLAEEASFPPVQGPDGRLFAPTARGLECISPQGLEKWRYVASSELSTSPAVSPSGNLALGLADGRLIVLDGFGDQKAELKLPLAPSAIVSLPEEASNGGFVCVAGDRLFFIQANGLGESELRLSGKASSVACLWDASQGRLVFAVLFATGEVRGYNDAGIELWTLASSGDADPALRSFGNRFYRCSRVMASLLTIEGKVLATMRIVQSARTTLLPARSGIMLSGGDDWILYAYRIERRIDPDPPEPRVSSRYGMLSPSLDDPLFLLNDADYLKKLLDSVEKSLKSGTIGGGERRYSPALAALALSAIDKIRPAEGSVLKSTSTLRARAALLIGSLGSFEAQYLLLRLFGEDPDPLVRAAASSALGMLGFDEGGRALAAFAQALSGQTLAPDDEGAYAICGAIDSILRYSGGMNMADGIHALGLITRKPYSAKVRAFAMEILDRIAGYN